MPLTLDLPPELENHIVEEAARAGLDPATFALRRLAEGFEAESPPISELYLLQKINEGLPETFWQAYDTLLLKRRNASLSEAEQQELIHLTDRMEAKNAERVGWLIKLAQKRGTTLKQLMADLGIRPRRLPWD